MQPVAFGQSSALIGRFVCVFYSVFLIRFLLCQQPVISLIDETSAVIMLCAIFDTISLLLLVAQKHEFCIIRCHLGPI